MWCTVHVLYQNGRRIPAEAAKANGVYGWLHMRSETPVVRMPKPEAFLLTGSDASWHRPLLYLENCSVRTIVGGGIRLVGFNMHLSSDPAVHQSWWVIPGERK